MTTVRVPPASNVTSVPPDLRTRRCTVTAPTSTVTAPDTVNGTCFSKEPVKGTSTSTWEMGTYTVGSAPVVYDSSASNTTGGKVVVSVATAYPVHVAVSMEGLYTAKVASSTPV